MDDFADELKQMEQELLDLKQFSPASSMLRANVFRAPLDFSGTSTRMVRFLVTYGEGDNDIMSEFFAMYRLIMPAAVSSNSQYIFMSAGQVASDELVILSTRPILSVVKA